MRVLLIGRDGSITPENKAYPMLPKIRRVILDERKYSIREWMNANENTVDTKVIEYAFKGVAGPYGIYEEI